MLPKKGKLAMFQVESADEQPDPELDAILASLRYLTSIESLGPDADAWRAWWLRVRKTFFRPVRKRDPTNPQFD